jgi:hypothetical protein
VLSTMDALLGGTSNSRESDGSLNVDLGEGERMEVEIMGSETGSYRTQKGAYGPRSANDESPKQAQTEQGLVVRKRASRDSKALSV